MTKKATCTECGSENVRLILPAFYAYDSSTGEFETHLYNEDWPVSYVCIDCSNESADMDHVVEIINS